MGIRMTIKDTDAVTLDELLTQLPDSAAAKEVALLKKHGDAWEKVAKDFSVEVERLKLDISCLKVQVKDRGNSYQEKVKENEKLIATLKEVSGCHEKHNTPKLCNGCLISIFDALDEDEPDH